jgi:uncharacterized protein YndB with AHSA1/START domain
MTKNETTFTKDVANKKLIVVRAFDAKLEPVWNAWTQSELLDQWWAPKPYKTETKKMDFREGGIWLYAMIGPDGDKSNCRVDFHEIELHKSILSDDMFCDEEGTPSKDFPLMHWHQLFEESGDGTTVTVTLTFDDIADLETILKMGFQEGFTAALGNLDDYFSTASI